MTILEILLLGASQLLQGYSVTPNVASKFYLEKKNYLILV